MILTYSFSSTFINHVFSENDDFHIFCNLHLTICQVYFTFVIENHLMKIQLENRIKVLRAEHSITQEELGKACGLSRQSINAIEKGKFIPTILSALKISNYFGVKVEDIFIVNK